MAQHEIDRFIEVWEREAATTAKLLRSLPSEQYDFRPDPDGRSMGELAWHLAEGDGYITLGIERGSTRATRSPRAFSGRERSPSWRQDTSAFTATRSSVSAR